MFGEHIVWRMEGRYKPERLAGQFYFHHYRYDSITEQVAHGGALFGLLHRGTVSKGRPFHNGRHLVYAVPEDKQEYLFSVAQDRSRYEPVSGAWGFALRNPVSEELSTFVPVWLEEMGMRNGEFPHSVFPDDVRCLPSDFLAASITVQDEEIATESFTGMIVQTRPCGIRITDDIPNVSGLRAQDIQQAIDYFISYAYGMNSRRY